MTPPTALLAYSTLVAAIVFLFVGSARVVHPKVTTEIWGWLQRRPEHGDWGRTFLAWFDQVFRTRAVRLPFGVTLHLPSPGRSILVSFLSTFVLALLWILGKDTLSRPLRFEGFDAIPTEQIVTLGVIYGGATIITNWIPDYLSLVQSRYVMGRMAQAKSGVGRASWLALDVILTAGVAFLALFVGELLILPFVAGSLDIEVGCFTPETFDLGAAWTIFVSGLTFTTPPGTLNFDAAGIYIYSTFLTSVWVWIYLISGVAIRISGLARIRPFRLGEASPRPLALLAIVSTALCSVAFWAHVSSQEARPDVYIAVPTGEALAQEGRAEALRAAMEAQGLRAVVGTGADDSRPSDAELLVVIGAGSGEGALEALLIESHRAALCGERPHGTVLRYEPEYGQDDASVVEWAKTAPSLLSPDQVTQCRELRQLPAVPVDCGR